MAGGGDQLVKWAWRPENNYRWAARMRDGYGRKTQFLECAQRALYCTHSPSCSTPQHSRTKDSKVKVNNSFGSNLGNDVLNDPFVKKDHNISVFSSHAENSLVGIGSVLEKIVARATGKGPSLSTYSAAAGGNSSSVWQTLLHNQGPFEPKSQTPLSEWLTYVELLAPTGRDKVSKFAVKIAQTLNSKQDAQLEKFKMKLTVPDAVHVLTTLKTPLSAYVFYEWLRKQSYYIPHKSIYGAVFERLTTCMHLSVDTWDDELHVVMEDMLRKKMALDNGQFQRLLAWGCESGSKQPYSSRRMQWYVDWFMKMRKIGFSPHFSTYEKLMKMCNKLGMYESTLSLFKEIPMNTYLWPFKLALCACRGLNNLEMAEQLLNEMKVRDIKPDAKCFTNLLGLYADHGHADKAEELFEEMKRAGVMIDLPVYTSVIHAYGRVGRVEQAQFIFRSIRGKLDPGIYRAMVACYRDAGHLNELLALINEAKGNGIQVGPTCYESAFQACVDKGHWKFAMDIIKDMQACGMLPSPKLYCMLLHVYTKVNDYDACESLFFDMIKMDLQSSEAFEIIIKMYMSLERFSCAMGAFKLMNEGQHCRPTAEIYEQIIPLIMKTSLSDAMKKFNDMRSANYIPSLSVYALLIWEHVKAGDMLQSRKLYNDMLIAGLQPDEHILSCMQHSGEEALENADRCADPLKLTCNR